MGLYEGSASDYGETLVKSRLGAEWESPAPAHSLSAATTMPGPRSSQHRHARTTFSASAGPRRRMRTMAFALALAVSTLSLPVLKAAPATQFPPPPANLLQSLAREAPGLRLEILQLALTAMANGVQRGLVPRHDLLTVIDYSLPSNQPRLFTFDLVSHRLVFRELVAHGKNSGENMTSRFSNDPGSLESSLGLFVTAGTYFGGNGYSLRLRGLEQGFNDSAWDRMIVMHGASYVSQAAARLLGRLGRSWGCPAVRKEVAQTMIEKLKGGTAIFAYYPDRQWLHASAFLK